MEEEQDESYLGYEKWLPSPPKVVKPRSVFNAATLAYIGDCIYEVCFGGLFWCLSLVAYTLQISCAVFWITSL